MVVILDSSTTSPTKSRPPSDWPHSHTDSSNATDRDALLSPPAYEREPDLEEAKPPQTFDEPAGGRFFKAFCVAVVLYGLTAALVRICFGELGLLTQPLRQPDKADGEIVTCGLPWVEGENPPPWTPSTPDSPDWPFFDGSSNFASPSPRYADEVSISMANPPYISKMNLTVPIDQLLFFLSKGSLSQGLLRFVAADPKDGAVAGAAKVELSVMYWSLEARNLANVCILSRKEGAYGLGIYTPRRWPTLQKDRLGFYITVTLPASQSRPLTMGTLDTKMPHFSHELGNLAPALSFGSVSVEASNMPMRVQSVASKYFSAKTTNSPIIGFFNVTDTLTLATTNAVVKARIGVSNEDWHAPTTVDIQTSNGLLEADLALLSPHSGGDTAGGFKITTTTSNRRLSVNIITAPADAHINYDGKTSNAGADLVLPPAFEGTITATTSRDAPNTLGADNDPAEDPTGRGRRRAVSLDSVGKGVLLARTWWGAQKDVRELGSAKIMTSKGPVTVVLGH